MRKFLAVAILVTLAGCGGGGGGSTPAPPSTPSQAPAQPQGNLVTPTFTIVVPAKTKSSKRTPRRVSPSTLSVTITRTTQTTITPTSVTSAIDPATCPCVVNGPPSPPGVVNTFTVTTFDTNNGTGNALDTGTDTFTPIAGQNNPQTVTLMGIPASVAISGVPANFAANTAGQTATLSVTASDADGNTISSGTYANPITLTDPDTNGTQGSQVTGTNVGSCGSATCVTLTGPADTATLNYGGLAENAVSLAATATGVTTANATFTPVLNAITGDAGNTTTSLGGTGIDLFTNDSGSPLGFAGTVSYGELGFTNTPYNKQLSVTGGAACSTFATVTAGANASNETPFTATAIASPVSGQCTLTVTDNLTDQPNALPTFKVTYTTSSVSASGKHRRN
jgi:hypothetical protein